MIKLRRNLICRYFHGIILLIFFLGCTFKDSKNENLFYEIKGKGESIVFLHGILGSHRYWDGVITDLSQTHQLILLDLLGFGKSPKPKLDYTVAQHLQKIDQVIKANVQLDQKFVVVGHSMGAILALNYAIVHAGEVKQLILINPPMVTDEQDLKQTMADSSSTLMVTMTFNKTWGMFVCKLHEWIPSASYPLIRIFEPELPPAVAMAAGQHTWESYSGSFKHVLLEQDFYELLAKVPEIPTLIIASDNDMYTKVSALKVLPKRENLKTLLISGTHNVLLSDPKRVTREIQEFIK